MIAIAMVFLVCFALAIAELNRKVRNPFGHSSWLVCSAVLAVLALMVDPRGVQAVIQIVASSVTVYWCAFAYKRQGARYSPWSSALAFLITSGCAMRLAFVVLESTASGNWPKGSPSDTAMVLLLAAMVYAVRGNVARLYAYKPHTPKTAKEKTREYR